jgi:hypothetical protein
MIMFSLHIAFTRECYTYWVLDRTWPLMPPPPNGNSYSGLNSVYFGPDIQINVKLQIFRKNILLRQLYSETTLLIKILIH